ncbi:helix-turn-helix transcriptional regulator [Brevundimonas sp. M20]|nr:helix-turn-helix transcriptional regulator [Brevundimonas sp. M20]
MVAGRTTAAASVASRVQVKGRPCGRPLSVRRAPGPEASCGEAWLTDPNNGEGVREATSWRDRKRRATAERISACAIRLFLDQGFDAVTVEAIAEAAGVSRRSFFDYFRTKEEVLFAWQAALPPEVRPSMLAWPADGAPGRGAGRPVRDRQPVRPPRRAAHRPTGGRERTRPGRAPVGADATGAGLGRQPERTVARAGAGHAAGVRRDGRSRCAPARDRSVGRSSRRPNASASPPGGLRSKRTEAFAPG